MFRIYCFLLKRKKLSKQPNTWKNRAMRCTNPLELYPTFICTNFKLKLLLAELLNWLQLLLGKTSKEKKNNVNQAKRMREERENRRRASSLAACVRYRTSLWLLYLYPRFFYIIHVGGGDVARATLENESPTIRRTDQFQWDATVKGNAWTRLFATLYFATDTVRITVVQTLILGVLVSTTSGHYVFSRRNNAS